jgi:hypothetical protein
MTFDSFRRVSFKRAVSRIALMTADKNRMKMCKV